MKRWRREYSYDPACADLARHFLPEEAGQKEIDDLAQYIQDQIELYLYSPGESQ